MLHSARALLAAVLQSLGKTPGSYGAHPQPRANVIVAACIAFVLSLILALLVTPLVRRAAKRHGLVDHPSARKVHLRPIPRVGGLAIIVSFLIPVLAYALYGTLSNVHELPMRQVLALLLGSAIVFCLGFWDDIRGLTPKVKFAIQALAAVVAYLGGVAIYGIDLPGSISIHLGAFSLPVTVLWFLLVVNAINLIDGLDGLAAGVSFFSSIVLLLLCVLNGQLAVSVGLAALAGAVFGFLRYNFNPASIFMGDSGSYFIGYMLAALSILGSIKSQASVTILIPILAMGLPLMDTLWSAIRRFVLGQGLFKADRNHLHHRLLKLGYTHRRAVLMLYGATALMGIASLLMVRASDHQAAAILVLIAIGAGIIIRRLGYVDYITSEKIIGWFRDVTDVMGMGSGRGSFLATQLAIWESETVEEAWQHIVEATARLGMDYVSMELMQGNNGNGTTTFRANPSCPGETAAELEVADSKRALRIGFPVGDENRPLAYIVVSRDLATGTPEYHTLRRVEHLRRTVSGTLARLYGVPVRPLMLTPRSHPVSAMRPSAAKSSATPLVTRRPAERVSREVTRVPTD